MRQADYFRDDDGKDFRFAGKTSTVRQTKRDLVYDLAKACNATARGLTLLAVGDLIGEVADT
jgi:hypothetical protein